MTAVRFARELDEARRAGRTLDLLLTERGLGTLDDAYAVQAALTNRRLSRGERIVGWKLGYTSLAMREQMSIAEPNFGPLTDAMVLGDGVAVPSTALQPRVEPEIALRLERAIPPGASVDEVLAATSAVYACLEIVDSVWTGYRFTLLDNTADGSSAGWVVLGPQLPRDDLPAIEVELSVDGVTVARASGAAAGGHPARGVAWLADQLAGRPRGLEAGDLVITGGLTAAQACDPGTAVEARFGAAAATVSTRRPD